MRTISEDALDEWATTSSGPVALHLKQRLLPVDSIDGTSAIIFPPTYANIGYNIDALSDGTKVALIDSVGSQANRMEPIFKAAPEGQPNNPLADLAPQIEIVFKRGKKNNEFTETISIFDIAHRSADAVVMSCSLISDIEDAFKELQRYGNCSRLCALAPTSLVFGVWDSRGIGEKRPRLVRSVIRAWDVDLLHTASQYNSIWKQLDEEQRSQLDAEAKAKKVKLSERGFADAPSIFRKVEKMSDFRDGSPNLEKRVLGGVMVRDRIEREVTINLVALRGLRGANAEETESIRKYLLGLSLVAATADIDMFLREGCNLRYTGEDEWYEIPRRGDPNLTDLSKATDLIKKYTIEAHESFKERFKDLIPRNLRYDFEISKAKQQLKKKKDD